MVRRSKISPVVHATVKNTETYSKNYTKKDSTRKTEQMNTKSDREIHQTKNDSMKQTEQLKKDTKMESKCTKSIDQLKTSTKKERPL